MSNDKWVPVYEADAIDDTPRIAQSDMDRCLICGTVLHILGKTSEIDLWPAVIRPFLCL